MSASTHHDQAHRFVPTDNHQSHTNCINSSSHQVLDSMDLLQLEDSNWPIDSSIQRSTGNLPLQQNMSIGAVNGSSMRSRNNHEDQCCPDASPNTPNVPQSPYLLPFQTEMERIQKERGQITKLHDDLKLLLKSECEKELDSITKKYDLPLQIAEMEFAEKQKDLDTIYNKVHAHKLLAEAMTQVQDTDYIFGVTASISEPVSSEQRTADPQISSENFSMAAILSPNSELPRVEESAVVLCTSATFANLSTSDSRVTPTPNYQSVILIPSQPSIQTLSYAANAGAGCEQRRPAPHLRPFRHTANDEFFEFQPIAAVTLHFYSPGGNT
ncbi:hypothetical protein RND71_028805 [Anisodus tanguticus]|uniref:Uncharacterized protein n=1 Tax=Anisodus tanguticus TaxID=243964 RepID=A0AAE1V2Y2_9SOLA|nr:hypothetical protein RND71_028805 [Anisodus tanguticus]